MEESGVERAVADACKALGLKEYDLFASRVYDDGRVVIVTTDGRKLEWRKADKAEKTTSQKGKEPR